MFGAALSGNASLQGDFSVGYCPTCNGVYPSDDYQYEQITEGSSFYTSSIVGYNLIGSLELSAGIPGLSASAVASIGIKDENAFDDVPPVIQLPEFQVFKDVMKFTPQNAVSKSR